MRKKSDIPVGYKYSSLGIIPEQWHVWRLSNLCLNKGDYGLNAPASDYSDDLPTYLRITDINDDGSLCRDDMKSVDDPSAGNYLLNDGDIVFACTGATVGKTYLYKKSDGQLVYAGYLIKFSPDSKRLLPYYLKANTETGYYWNWVTVTSQRSGQPGINAAEYCSLKIAVPSIKEQERICFVLQLWDEAIEKQMELIQKLKLRKRGLMQQLLTGKKRLPGFTDKWKTVKLGDMGSFFKGAGIPKDSIIKKGHKCITYGDLYTKYDYVIKGVTSFIDDDATKASTEIRYGDICFAGSGETKEDIGKCAAFVDDEKGYAGGDIIVFRPNDTNPIFLSYILNSDDVVRQKSSMGQGHSVVHIYPYQLEKITINLPDRKEQDLITNIMLDADKEINMAKAKLLRLQYQKRGLMQQLLTGKKRI